MLMGNEKNRLETHGFYGAHGEGAGTDSGCNRVLLRLGEETQHH